MENTNVFTVEVDGVITEHITIDHGNGEFTSMLKSTYDEQQAKNVNLS